MNFFRFYKYLFKNDKKKYDYVLNNFVEILYTPLIVTFLSTGSSLISKELAFIPLIFLCLSIINGAICIIHHIKGRKIEEEQIRKRAEELAEHLRAEREKRERIRKAEEEDFERQLKKWREEMARRRQEQEHIRKKQQEEFERWKRRFDRNSFGEGGNRFNQNFSNNVDQNMKNAMHLMGLREGFTKQDVKSAYRRLSKIHHPDVGGLEENFKKLNTAYNYVMERI